jgi:hypothetical protein
MIAAHYILSDMAQITEKFEEKPPDTNFRLKPRSRRLARKLDKQPSSPLKQPSDMQIMAANAKRK